LLENLGWEMERWKGRWCQTIMNFGTNAALSSQGCRELSNVVLKGRVWLSDIPLHVILKAQGHPHACWCARASTCMLVRSQHTLAFFLIIFNKFNMWQCPQLPLEFTIKTMKNKKTIEKKTLEWVQLVLSLRTSK